MTPEEVFERADEITAETRYRIQLAREAQRAGFEAGRRSAFAEMARAWEQAARKPSQSPWMSGGGDQADGLISQTPGPVTSRGGMQKPNWRQDESAISLGSL